MLEFGFGRHDISVYEPEMTMMGWGVRTNRVRGVAVPLFARALVMRDTASDTRVGFVAIETLLVTQGLWWGVLDRLAELHPELGLGAHNLIVVATHTHSGPSGFGHHFWTNLNAPGFSPRVYAGLRDGIVAALAAAWKALRPGTASLTQTTVPLGDGVAFNRSWFAYNKNPDVTPVTFERRDEATDRTLTALRFRDLDGKLAGLVQWFALHGTAVHADNTRLHPDHKGLTAMALEAAGLGVVCAQECCGDVSPNYRWDPKRRHTAGKLDDDIANAQAIADVMVRRTDAGRPDAESDEIALGDRLEVATRFVAFGDATSHARFNRDGRPHRTTPATLGLSMAEGTAEGPGPLRRVRAVTRAMSWLAGLTREDTKVPFIDLAHGRDGRLFGVIPMGYTPPLDPVFAWVRGALKSGGVHAGAWVPEVVPLNLVRLGPLAIVAVPFEMTTVAGRRLRATVLASLPGVSHVVISPYANAYIGYLTTFEEYRVQHYEAGYTLFGPHTLGALRSEIEQLARQLGTTPRSGPAPTRIDTTPLERIAFGQPWQA